MSFLSNYCYSPPNCPMYMNTHPKIQNILEEKYDATYRGISRVKEMTTDLVSAISFEGEDPETIYHRFETKVGPNTIVKDDQVIKLALHYV